MISEKYIALFSHFISCGVREAIYILDGLMENKSDIQPEIIHYSPVTARRFAH